MDEKEIIKKVAFNIKVTRLQRGLTQFQLAEMIDVHEKYIGRVEVRQTKYNNKDAY